MPNSSSLGSSNSSWHSQHQGCPHLKPRLLKPSVREAKPPQPLVVWEKGEGDDRLAKNGELALVLVVFHLNRRPLLQIPWWLPSR